MTALLRLLGTVGLHVSAIEASLFCLLYHLFAPWWRHERGRSIMAFVGTIAAVLDLSALRSFFVSASAATPMGPMWLEGARLLVFLAVPVTLGWQLRMLWITQIGPARAKWFSEPGDGS